MVKFRPEAITKASTSAVRTISSKKKNFFFLKQINEINKIIYKVGHVFRLVKRDDYFGVLCDLF